MSAIVLTIAGTDRTKQVKWNTLNIERVLTRPIATCAFTTIRQGASDFKPTAGKEVVITLDGTRVFAGMILRVREVPQSYGLFHYECECSDYSRFLDSKLVVKSYANQTVNQIIADIKSSYFPSGFTTTAVNCPVNVSAIKFNYIPVTDCLTKLAELTGYDWYLDENKDLYFDIPTPAAAPIEVKDDNGSHVYESLILRDDITQQRNTIFIRGNTYLGAAFSASTPLRKDQIHVLLPYQFDDFGCSLTGTRLKVGIDDVDSFAAYDVLYNKAEKTVKLSKSYPEGTMFSFSGKPNYPVRVKLSDRTSISNTLSAEGIGDGIYQHLIIDDTLKSREGARERARAEINTWAQTIVEGEFDTHTDGFKPSMKVRINSSSRGLDTYYIVSRVRVTALTPQQLQYHVTLITTRTFGFIDLLRRLIRKETETLDIPDDERLDLMEFFPEELGVADDYTYTYQQPTWVAGNYNPTHLVTDRKRPAFADRVCKLGS